MFAGTLTIEAVTAASIERHIDTLSGILCACVHDNASVGFILPFGQAEAQKFWRESVAPALAGGGRVMLVAMLGDEIVGAAQLGLAAMPNQTHRADVMKVLVHPRHQRKGIGRALMTELERIAAGCGRTLLTLDTIAGDKAERLYASLGYELAGRIPCYARHPGKDTLEATSVMFKMLAGPDNVIASQRVRPEVAGPMTGSAKQSST